MTAPDAARRTDKGPDLILQGVTFAYGPHAEPVLRNLDLTVPAGDHLAIVGPSGIGKSTLAALVCGLLRPDSGTVTLGGAIAVELPSDRLAEMRTLIPQEAYVFSGTVWDNLTYLCPTATMRQVENAVVAFGVEELVARLGGVGAELAPAELSAGERQLVALVRAYISAAPVVVLDEATCFLDPAAERRAEEAFADRDGTLIVIAHRVSSALRARRVLVLDGTSAAVGDHQMLQRTSPLYRELLGHWRVGPAARRPDRVNGEYMSVQPAVAASAAPAPLAAGGPGADQLGPVIFGRVTEGGNVPLVGATLTLTDLSGRQLDRDSADSGGYYRLSPPTSGSYLVICASEVHQPTAALVVVADVAVCHDVVLSGAAGANLSGSVTIAETGQPIGDAVVTLVDGHGDVVAAASTGPEGRFSFAGLAQGHYTLTVAASSLQPVARSLQVPGTGHLIHDVEMVARVQLTGVVRTATAGVPVPEALATLIAANGQVVASAITDAAGGFAFDDLRAGSYTLIATGYPPVAAEMQLRAGVPAETVITLWPPTVEPVTTDSPVVGSPALTDAAAGHD